MVCNHIQGPQSRDSSHVAQKQDLRASALQVQVQSGVLGVSVPGRPEQNSGSLTSGISFLFWVGITPGLLVTKLSPGD